MPPKILVEVEFLKAITVQHKKFFDGWKDERKNRIFQHAALCCEVYKNAANSKLKCLVAGRMPNDTDWKDLPGLDDLLKANFDFTSETKNGSVLNSNNWTIVLNDSWILGGVHANLPFYLASPRDNKATFESSNKKLKMTVTARELVGLMNFGYQPVKGAKKDQGEVMVCTNKKAAQDASFEQYVDLWDEAMKDPDGTIATIMGMPAIDR